MAKELQVQTDIKVSVRKDGGWATKLSNRFTIGIPDLLVLQPPFVPFVAEVKDLGEVVDNFDRQLDVSPKQAHTLLQMASSYRDRRVCGLFVHCIHRGQHKLYGLHHSERRLSHRTPDEFVLREKGGYYEIKRLLERMGVPRI